MGGTNESTKRPGTRPALTSEDRPGRWAVVIAASVLAVIAVSLTILGIAYLVGGWAVIDDTWIGLLAAAAVLGGAFVSLAAFVGALILAIRRHLWRPMLLPLLVFPAIVSFVVLGELFWWE